MKKFLVFLLMVLMFISCKNKHISENQVIQNSQKPIKWDFTSNDFKDNTHHSLNMLGGYNTLAVDKIADSLIVINLNVFKGWKNKGISFADTLKLTNSIKQVDNLGNQTEQILNYSKYGTVFFQLWVIKQSTVNQYNYEGKLFIETKSLNFFCDYLYVK